MGGIERSRRITVVVVIGAFACGLIIGFVAARTGRSPSPADKRDALLMADAEVLGILHDGGLEVREHRRQVSCAEIGGDHSSS